jgi:hypothetical protein
MKLPEIASAAAITTVALVATAVAPPSAEAQCGYGCIQCTSAWYGSSYCEACYVYTPEGWVLSGASWS